VTAPRAARFRVARRIDGADFATVEVVRSRTTEREPLVRIRLARRREVIEVPLGDVVEVFVWRAAKVAAAASAKSRSTVNRRGGR
jgi:hypothetical protein